MRDFRKLRVWEESHSLTIVIYGISKAYPSEELFGLTSQMRRSSASIGTNIAEGCGRESNREFVRFLQIALGSASELDYQLLLSRDLAYINPSVYEEVSDKIDKVKRQLVLLIRKVRNSSQ